MIDPSVLASYAGKVGIFPTYIGGGYDKAPAGRAAFPDLDPTDAGVEIGLLVAALRDRPTTPEEIVRWWSTSGKWGVGLNCGDLQCIDFDDPTIIEAWLAKLRENGVDDILAKTARARTRFGYHVWCRVPGCREASHKLARHSEPVYDERRGKKVLTRIETRGYGGYALVAPSEGYAWLGGRTVLDIPIMDAEEYEALIYAATLLDEGPPEEKPEPRPPRPVRDDEEESPNDWFNRTASWDDLLTRAGGRFFRQVGERAQYTRPGKSRGPSIVTGNGRSGQNLAKVHTSNWPPFQQGETMSKYFCYAIQHHARDTVAATRAISQMPGYPKRSRERKPSARVMAPVSTEDDLSEPESSGPIGLPSGVDFMRNDLGNARRLVDRYGCDLRYCSEWGRFLTWDDARWAVDTQDGATARRFAHDVTDGMLRSETEDVRKWGNKSQSSGAISAMLRESQAMVGILARDLDTHDHLLGVANGVLDLRTGTLVGNTRDLLLTKQARTYWDPDAKCPVFETFLRQIMQDKRDLVSLLLRAMGYSLTGSTREQKFFLLYGARGRNGKSTLLEVLQHLLGDELCGPINKKLLTASDRDSARFAMASLEGKRMVFANESSRGRSFDTEFIKELAGGTTVQAERKGKDEYKFQLKAKLWNSVNAMPSAEWSSSYGDRAIPIPFERSFYATDNPEYRDGDLPPDKDLLDKLRAELPGILSLLVRTGSIPWYEEGLVIPDAVARLLESYRAENDNLGQWIEERCKAGESERMRMHAAFTDYRAFLKASGIAYRGRINDFHHEILQRPGVSHISPKNKSTIVGLSLRPEDYSDWEEETDVQP